jgi:copper oxidase (laccase) domain-containing protein
VSALCTISDPERFFSYRRDGRECGRQAVIAHLGAA